jgi:hypothetical protein
MGGRREKGAESTWQNALLTLLHLFHCAATAATATAKYPDGYQFCWLADRPRLIQLAN